MNFQSASLLAALSGAASAQLSAVPDAPLIPWAIHRAACRNAKTP
nr:MAG TPA_asm: hypothetical protein [Caudoviricetes sp.]